MDSDERFEAFDRGHKSGFEAGYKAAMQDAWWILNKAQDRVNQIEDSQITERYHSIFRGLEDPTVLVTLQEMMT